MKPFARQHDAGVDQLFVELAHLGQLLLGGQYSGFRGLAGLYHYDEPHCSLRRFSVRVEESSDFLSRSTSFLLMRRLANLVIDTRPKIFFAIYKIGALDPPEGA